jgi:hypothetical protein
MKELFEKLKEVKAVTPTESGIDTYRLRYLVAETRANNNYRREAKWKELRATESV